MSTARSDSRIASCISLDGARPKANKPKNKAPAIKTAMRHSSIVACRGRRFGIGSIIPAGQYLTTKQVPVLVTMATLTRFLTAMPS